MGTGAEAEGSSGSAQSPSFCSLAALFRCGRAWSGVLSSPEDFILELLEFLLAGRDVDHQRVLLLLQLRPLLADHDTQQLRLQACGRLHSGVTAN